MQKNWYVVYTRPQCEKKVAALLTKKKIENWLVWIVVDAFAAGLYFYKELYPTAILFVVYTIMAFAGYFQWKKSINMLK